MTCLPEKQDCRFILSITIEWIPPVTNFQRKKNKNFWKIFFNLVWKYSYYLIFKLIVNSLLFLNTIQKINKCKMIVFCGKRRFIWDLKSANCVIFLLCMIITLPLSVATHSVLCTYTKGKVYLFYHISHFMQQFSFLLNIFWRMLFVLNVYAGLIVRFSINSANKFRSIFILLFDPSPFAAYMLHTICI